MDRPQCLFTNHPVWTGAKQSLVWIRVGGCAGELACSSKAQEADEASVNAQDQ